MAPASTPSQHDTFRREERLDGVAEALAADTGRADAAEGDVTKSVTRRAVDPDGAGVDRLRDAHRSVVVVGEHRRVEAEVVGVRQFDGVRLGADGRDSRDGSELLLVQDAGARLFYRGYVIRSSFRRKRRRASPKRADISA